METGTPGPPAPEAPQAPAAGTITQTGANTPQIRPGSGPPSAGYAAVTEFDHQEEYSRFLPIVKGLLLIPHWFVLFFVFIAAFFAIVYAWFAVLITGKYPQGVHKFLVGTLRWTTRASAYALLMTDRYPPFSLDHDEEYPARFDVTYTEEIARWRPLVHWLLAYPYTLVAGVLMFLAYVCTFLAFFAILFTKKFPQGLFDFNVVAFRWQNRGSAYSLFMAEKYPPWEWG
jgi:hypothetical protein